MKHQKLNTTQEYSSRMAKVKLKGGEDETSLAKALWKLGIRYRKNYKKLPGSPDIAITKQKIAIFIDGEFWHGYDWENKKEKIKSNKDYWIEKIQENIGRDKRDTIRLEQLGWRVIRFWSKEVNKNLDLCIRRIVEIINEKDRTYP